MLQPEYGQYDLPDGLPSFTFGDSFNMSVVNAAWPKDLRRRSFGEDFDQYMDYMVLPDGLHSFSFGHNYNQSLDLPPFLLDCKVYPSVVASTKA